MNKRRLVSLNIAICPFAKIRSPLKVIKPASLRTAPTGLGTQIPSCMLCCVKRKLLELF